MCPSVDWSHDYDSKMVDMNSLGISFETEILYVQAAGETSTIARAYVISMHVLQCFLITGNRFNCRQDRNEDERYEYFMEMTEKDRRCSDLQLIAKLEFILAQVGGTCADVFEFQS